MRIRNVVVALTLLAALAGCSPSGTPMGDCPDLTRQAAYEAMRQLAASGLAADPSALREADAGTEVPDVASSEVALPRYADFTAYGDAEQAELLSALSSELVGVGAVFDQDEFFSSLDASGACAGWLSRS